MFCDTATSIASCLGAQVSDTAHGAYACAHDAVHDEVPAALPSHMTWLPLLMVTLHSVRVVRVKMHNDSQD